MPCTFPPLALSMPVVWQEAAFPPSLPLPGGALPGPPSSALFLWPPQLDGDSGQCYFVHSIPNLWVLFLLLLLQVRHTKPRCQLLLVAKSDSCLLPWALMLDEGSPSKGSQFLAIWSREELVPKERVEAAQLAFSASR